MNFNSDFNRKLLQLYILLNDEKEITYDSFNDYEKIEPSTFTRLIKEYQMMIIKLKLRCTLIKEKIKNEDNDSYFPKKIYYQTSMIDDYYYSTEDLLLEDKIKYMYVIFYLMLKNEQFITPKKFKQFLEIDINETSYKRFLDTFKETVGFDIYKNCFSSYVMEKDDA